MTNRPLRSAMTSVLLLSIWSCSTPPRAPQDFFSHVKHVSDADLLLAFQTARELEDKPEFDTEHSEILSAQMDKYLRVAGDTRFAAVASKQPARTRRAIRQYLELDRITMEYPATYALLRSYALRHRP
jgi:hypothetical protein